MGNERESLAAEIEENIKAQGYGLAIYGPSRFGGRVLSFAEERMIIAALRAISTATNGVEARRLAMDALSYQSGSLALTTAERKSLARAYLALEIERDTLVAEIYNDETIDFRDLIYNRQNYQADGRNIQNVRLEVITDDGKVFYVHKFDRECQERRIKIRADGGKAS